jgi:hypothetical protein
MLDACESPSLSRADSDRRRLAGVSGVSASAERFFAWREESLFADMSTSGLPRESFAALDFDLGRSTGVATLFGLATVVTLMTTPSKFWQNLGGSVLPCCDVCYLYSNCIHVGDKFLVSKQ